MTLSKTAPKIAKGLRRAIAAAKQLKRRKGKFYDRWLAGMRDAKLRRSQ